ncbi:MAG: hypothetical protein HPY55_06240 [Firmicutes bacterium]|nr:hypothetical protein [Bacillota bacterium]
MTRHRIARDPSEIRKLIAASPVAAVSLAPSYVCAFPGVEAGRIVSALRLLGFSRVEETACVLPEIFERRRRLLESHRSPVISNSCPRVVSMVKDEFPHAATYLVDAPSPMSCHCRGMRERVGGPVVFIGPCTAKAFEAERCGSADGVLSFSELALWFANEGIDLARLEPTEPDAVAPRWVLVSLLALDVSGLDQCRSLLASLSPSTRESRFIEALACPGGCLYGDGMLAETAGVDRRSILIHHIQSSAPVVRSRAPEDAPGYAKEETLCRIP